jgi:hypothetical protein
MSFIMQMGEGEFLSEGFKKIKAYADKYQRHHFYKGEV